MTVRVGSIEKKIVDHKSATILPGIELKFSSTLKDFLSAPLKFDNHLVAVMDRFVTELLTIWRDLQSIYRYIYHFQWVPGDDHTSTIPDKST